MRRRFVDDSDTRALYRERLKQIGEEIVNAVPGAAIAADQRYRESDLAIDFCEDVPHLPLTAIDRIVQLMQSHGLTAKVSSIHVNGWFGSYDKLSMTRMLMRERHGIDLDGERERYVFVGDSPNDAPMFAYFPHAVGVANIRDFGGRLAAEPGYVTAAASGAGFCELADCLLDAR
jgi:HAD superfamily hydrolase (TIGR01484 family)